MSSDPHFLPQVIKIQGVLFPAGYITEYELVVSEKMPQFEALWEIADQLYQEMLKNEVTRQKALRREQWKALQKEFADE